MPEVVFERCSLKKLFWKILQNSQENTCFTLVFFHRCFPITGFFLSQVLSCESCKIFKNTSGCCFWNLFWWDMFFSNSLYITFTWYINHFFFSWKRFLSSKLFLTYHLDYSLFWPLNLWSSSNLFPGFWLFLMLFGMLWMLVSQSNLSHVPHLSRITTNGTIFMQTLFSVSSKISPILVTRFLGSKW